MGEVAVAHQGADAGGAVRERLDAVEAGQVRDVDEAVRADDVALHQVEQVGAAAEHDGAVRRRSRDRVGGGRGAVIIEALHSAASLNAPAMRVCASSTASVMPA